MKKNIKKLISFAAAGGISIAGSLVIAAEAQVTAGNAKTEIRGSINEPSGAQLRHGNDSLGTISRASDLLGADVRNQQNEKIGEIKDFAVDLQSGRVPYTIVSSGGFFGVGDRMLAIPSSTFAKSGSQTLVLNMDKERLRAAPSFDKNNWPSMEDRTWGSQVFTYYGERPYWETTTSVETYRRSEISEPSGAEYSTTYVQENTGPFAETTTGLSRDRTPRKGLGAEDLTRNEQRLNNPDGYAESDSFFNTENREVTHERVGVTVKATPAPGARVYSQSELSPSPYDQTSAGLVRDRTPRQGLGADDLTGNDAKVHGSQTYAQTGVYVQEPSGAERSESIRTETRKNWSQHSAASTIQMGKVRRATDLIGMEVRNSQDERVGEIKDIVLDLQTGRVAYTLLSAGGFLGMGDNLYAVPPTLFTRGTDDRTFIFNVDKETLKAAPSVDKNNWSQSNNQQFTTEVYQYYQQPPYWQSSGEMREPSGGQQNWNRGSGQNSQGRRDYNSEQEKNRPDIQEPSGANRPRSSGNPNSAKTYSDPSAGSTQPGASQSAEPERSQSSQQQPGSTGTAAKESAELDAPDSTTQQTQSSSTQETVKEPAGATTTSTEPATSDDQAGSNSDRELSQKVRTALREDTDVSTVAPNVTVSAANGRITLRGTVASEQEKRSVLSKVQQIAAGEYKVDNQLEVKTSDISNPDPTSKP